ncbi:hypothetical protein BpHYR1_043874 [Brachionus plicatilis]|uniref:Uncharacterized protein n=1 Tax=Brachionus plicatilis TaxID=10195 RepID=A0A3M7QIS8_BRAPC|nr:hypothetical protein BpHYR1_043874 [Brachionus plicatilis]
MNSKGTKLKFSYDAIISSDKNEKTTSLTDDMIVQNIKEKNHEEHHETDSVEENGIMTLRLNKSDMRSFISTFVSPNLKITSNF